MREFITMWKYRKLALLCLFSALLYVAVVLPFEAGFFVFDLKAFQPLSALPLVFGLFFGPAGVIGAGLGTFFIEVYKGLSYLSPFFIAGNVILALLPYRLWDKLYVQQNADVVIPKSGKRIVLINLFLVVIVSAMSKGLIVGWGYTILHKSSFVVEALQLFINDTFGGLLLGIILMLLFLKRLRKWDMLWSEIMLPSDVGGESMLGAWIIVSAVLITFISSLIGSYWDINLLVLISGGLGILGILAGLFWKGKVA